MTRHHHRDPNDPRDPRASTLLVPSTSYAAGDFVLLGLPFDASIPTRGGAKMGPQAFREALPSLTTFGNGVELSGRIVRDLGDLDLPPESIREAHDRVQSAARDIFAAGATPFFVGGDNGLTGALLRGLAEARPNLKLGLVVIDSHYDVREYDDEDSLSSGTPYRRALETGICHGSRTFILGTRDFANSSHYDRWVREQGITTIPVDWFDLTPAHAIANEVRSKLEMSSDAIFLSIDIDAAELPGSSAAAPGTLSSREMIAIVRALARSSKLIGCDLSELSPPWDVSGMTAKLAARLFLEVLADRWRPAG
ncbi:MAG TPA: agmatinase family protein [Thermoanaerobaculia bacterium]|jgi:formimidoylglutamase|nr:agmatinase family protein [Thermoanaerobaculia bacterium]